MLDKFDIWNNLKKQVDKRNIKKFIKERQVWYVHIGKNVRYEQDGKWNDFKRPFLILKIIWNMYFWVIMTTKWKNNQFYYKLPYDVFGKDSYCILSQLRSFDKNRFIEKIWIIPKNIFQDIKDDICKIIKNDP